MPRPRWLKMAIVIGVLFVAVMSVILYFWRRGVLYEEAMERAMAAASIRDWNTAITALKKALKIYPNDPKAVSLIEKYKKELSFDEALKGAEAALKKSNWTKAVKLAEEALRIHPDSDRASRVLSDARRHIEFSRLLRKAEDYFRAESLRKALSAYEEALRRVKDKEVEHKIAELKARLAEYDSAVKQAISYKPLPELLPEIETALDRAKAIWKKGKEIAELTSLVERLRKRARREGVLVGVLPFVVQGVEIDGSDVAEVVRATLPEPLRGLTPAETLALLQRHSIIFERAEDISATTILRFQHGLRFLLGGSIIRGKKTIVVEGWLNNLRTTSPHQRHRIDVVKETDIKPALRLLSALLFLNENQKKAYLAWFEAARENRWAEAIDLFQKAYAKWPEVPSFKKAKSDLIAMMWSRVVEAERVGRWEEVALLCGYVLKLNPQHKKAKTILKRTDDKIVEQIELAVDNGRYDEARRLYEAVKTINPSTEAERVIEEVYKRLVGRARQAMDNERYNSVRLFVGYALKLRPEGKEAKAVLDELNSYAAERVKKVCEFLAACNWTDALKAVETALKYLPDNKLLKAAKTLATSPHKSFTQLLVKPAHTASVETVAFSPDSKLLATGGRDNTIRLFSVPDLTERARYLLSSAVFSVAFSSKGGLLAVGCADGSVVLFDVKNGLKKKQVLKHHSDIVYALVFTSGDEQLVCGSADNTITVWEKTGRWELMRVIKEHNDAVRGLAVSPDGSVVASSSHDGTVRLWSVKDGFTPLSVLSGRGRWLNTVVISPDGKWVVGGGRDFVLFVWSLRDGDLLKTLKGHTNSITFVTFSPYGRYIASAGWDKKLIIWDTKNGFAKVMEFDTHKEAVMDGIWSANGRYIAAVGRNGSLVLWGPSKEKLENLILKLKTLKKKLSSR